MPDAIFAERRLAELYDPLDPDRSDLDTYLAMAGEFGARKVLDVGCGTGTLACLLAGHGLEVTAIDPAVASLAVARRKPGADGAHPQAFAACRQKSRIKAVGAGPVISSWLSRMATVPVDGVRCAAVPVPPTQP